LLFVDFSWFMLLVFPCFMCDGSEETTMDFVQLMALGAAAAVLAIVVFVAFRFALAQGASREKTVNALVEADAQRERLVTVLRSVPHGLLVLDAGDIVLMANQPAASLWGLGVSEMPGLAVSNLSARGSFRAKEDAWVLADFLSQPQSGEAVEVESVLVDRMYEVSLSPVTSPTLGEVGTIVLFRDITQMREIEALRTNLLHMMVHDLRTPLSGIYTALKAALEQGQDETSRQLLDLGSRSAEKMMRMVEDMVDIGRIEAGEMPLKQSDDVQLMEAVNIAVDQVKPLAEAKGIQVDISVMPESLGVYADSEKVVRILANLLVNAIKFTPPSGGKVMLRASASGSGQVQVEVEDNGQGIPVADRDRIFDRFAQAGQRQQWGSGLGLAFCKLAVERHGGRIWIEGAPVQGSIFVFTLPARG
jgi:signal transduction histidine kinase